MKALIVVESCFGNTRRVARAIADGIGPTTEVIDAAVAPTRLDPDLELLVIGGPTHAFGMSRPGTRAEAVRQGGTPTPLGIREWIARFAPAGRPEIAVFDSRVSTVRHLPGSAARAAGRALRTRGLRLAAVPRSFYVADTPGPVCDGELDRARHWGTELAATTGQQRPGS